jgi:hypothetical protein
MSSTHRVRGPTAFQREPLSNVTNTSERSFTPSQLLMQDNLSFGTISAGALREEDSKKQMATAPLKVNGQPAELVLIGELTTDGISSKTFEGDGKRTEKLTFGMRLSDPADEEAMHTMVELLDSVVEDISEFEVRPVLRDGVLYLKVKTSRDGGNYAFQSNMKLSPKKDGGELFQFMPVEVRVGVNCYFNVMDDGAGLFFPVRRLDKANTQKEMSTQTESAEAPKSSRGVGARKNAPRQRD